MILEVDGQKVESREEVNNIRDTKKIGDPLTFKIVRNGETLDITVTLTDTIEETADDAAQQDQQQQEDQNQGQYDQQNPFGGGDWSDFFDSFFNW